MKTFCGNIRHDLTRSMLNKSFIPKVLLIALVCLFSHADVLRALYMGFELEGYDIIGIYNFTIHYDRFKIILLVVIASIYTNSFCVEFNSGSLKYILNRCGIKMYIISKSITIFISAALAYMCGLFLSFLVLAGKIPFVEKVSAFYQADSYFTFESLSPQEHPVFWVFLTSMLFILSISVLCTVGFYISLYWTDSLIIICIPAITYFSITSLTNLMPTIFYLPGYGNNIKLISENLWINYGFKVAANIAGIVLFTALSYRKLRRNSYEGTI